VLYIGASLPGQELPWAGCYLATGDSSAANNGSIVFREVRTWSPQSRQVYRWYVHRDPGLAGTGDIAGAQVVVNRMRPAHTLGLVCETDAAECDDTYSRCDRDPLGE
jgi:hypothetical protein